MNALVRFPDGAADRPLEQGIAALVRHDVHEGVELLRQAAALAPGEWEPNYWLYAALMRDGDWDGAQAALNTARTLQSMASLRSVGVDMVRLQADKVYAAEVGRQVYAAHLVAPASLAFGFAIDLEQPSAELFVYYGLSLQHQCRMDEAIGVFDAASGFFDNAAVDEFKIFALFYAPDRGTRVLEAGKAWAARYADALAPAKPNFANARNARRRLKIGYVGPSFASSQISRFLLPVLEAHDPKAVEIHLYGSAVEAEAGLPAHAKRCSIAGLSDTQVADRVRADGIDILIDVWGHTTGSRLGVFARRPAPVQIAWINFVQTTGMSAMDYVLHAEGIDALGTADLFVEKIWEVGPVFAPFRPLEGRLDPAPTPALAKGHVTYGSFNHPAKLSDETVAAWGAILRSRPDDRLVLKYRYFADPVLQRTTLARFACHGVYAEQIEFRGETKGAAYLAEFADIDLALDPSPCPGGTTTCEALSNGVPVLTLKGADFYARIGLPGVLPCGLPELVAEDWEDYVARALALTEDFTALDELRARVRPGFDNSIYRDEVGFTRKLEEQYRTMFKVWADGQAV